MKRGLTAVAALCGAVAVLAIAAGAATTTLPGGTGFTVAVTAPAAGAVLPEATPFTVQGHATIGTAAPVANTYLVTAIDVSGSTVNPVATTACGNQNPTHDPAFNTVLDCELAAGLALNNEASAQGTVARVGLIGFAGRIQGSSVPLSNEAAILDLSASGGLQSFTPPAADAPANGTRDVNDVLASAFNQNIFGTVGLPPGMDYTGFTSFTPFTSPGNTNYWAAVTQIRNLFAGAPAGVTKVAVILSDGDSNVGSPSNQPVEAALAGISGIKIYTFAIGTAASCLGSGAPNYGTLQTIANLTGATCTHIANPGDAATIVPDAIGSQITAPQLSDDGVTYSPPDGPPVPTFHGPGSLDFQKVFPAAAATPGTHHLCARARGTDGGGSVTLPDCIDVSILARPVVTTGLIGATAEGSPFSLSGSADHGDTSWTATGGTGTCTFADASSPTTDVTCTDDGDYTLTLTADDHVNPPQSVSGTLHVSNVAPGLSLANSVSGLTGTVTGTVTDAGADDTHTCSFAWGDGNTTSGVAVAGGTCAATHTYAAGVASATVDVTATDDDGGATTRSVTLTLNRAPSCSAVASSLTELWPANHTLQLITLRGATDSDGDTLAYAITSVRQDEPTNGTGDGDTAIDAVNAGPGAVSLRAERAGGGDGRVYTIAFTVSDGNGGSCEGTVQVTVPKSASKPAVLSPGPGYDSYH
jgi:trimeric autotransporter adhesin